MTQVIAHRLNEAFALQARGEFTSALAVCSEVQRMAPKHPGSFYIQGVIFHKMGEMDSAERAFRRTIKLNPNDIGALSGFGMVALQRGRLADAIRSLQAARALAPNDSGLMGNLALCYRTQHRYREAVALWRSALEVAPDNVESLLNLAVTLDQLGETSVSTQYFEAALQRAPWDPHVLIGVSNHAIRIGDMESARSCLTDGLKHCPDHASILESLASLEMIAGDTEVSRDLAWRALSASPDRLSALALLLDSSDDSEQILADDRVRSAIDIARRRAAHPTGSPVALLEAGRILDKAGLYPEAAAAFKAGNGKIWAMLQATGQGYSAKQMEVYAEAAARFHAAFQESATDSIDVETRKTQNPCPIFIIGMPRSGTTLIEQVLGAHPNVRVCGEMMALQHIASELGSPHFAAPDAAWIGRLPLAAKARDGYVARILQAARDGVGENAWHGARWFVDKNPFNFLYIDLARALFPGARFVYCARAAADVALSIYSMHFVNPLRFDCRFEDIAHYQKMCDTITMSAAPVLGDRFIPLRYEEFVADPEAQTRQLLSSIGLPWHDGCLSHATAPKRAASASQAQVRRAVNTSAVNRNARYRGLLPIQE